MTTLIPTSHLARHPKGKKSPPATDGDHLGGRPTQRYVNQPTFFGHVEPDEKRNEMELVACKIKPTRVVIYG